jgi:hypothetical protein
LRESAVFLGISRRKAEFLVIQPSTLFYAVAFPLQNFAVRSAGLDARYSAVPDPLDGNLIHLRKQSLGVAKAWNGIRSLVSLFSMAVGWSAQKLSGKWRQDAGCNNLILQL